MLKTCHVLLELSLGADSGPRQCHVLLEMPFCLPFYTMCRRHDMACIDEGSSTKLDFFVTLINNNHNVSNIFEHKCLSHFLCFLQFSFVSFWQK
jgi:hypothetical protein